ncbi:hypothetical protein [Flammeovirga aprica]|uniref:DUF4595 domain-containing protein n=1 Tax=Flammeovirga aprica JL-4 TaxID=694437 RepID=A0A7X9XB08_9BACT|nr:hypothetical protein [Flammeovirga aprica]NME70242.1 hypothetical protein [Flammeovirga aprica JL-4]
MIKLRTLFLLVPFLAMLSCSSDDGEIPYFSKPVEAECSLSSLVTTLQYTENGSQRKQIITSKEEYTYTDTQMNSYVYTNRDVFTDSAGVDTVLTDISYEFEFAYSNDGLLQSVSNVGNELLRVKPVDGRVYSMSVVFSNSEEIEYFFTYDGAGKIASISNEESNLDSALTVTFAYQDGLMTKMEFYFGDENEAYQEYTYFDGVKNPNSGINFFAITLIEANGFFYSTNVDYEVFSTHLVKDIVLGLSNGDGGFQKDFIYDDTFTYTTNSKGYPTAGAVPDEVDGDIKLSANQQFSYVNCDN